MIYSGTLIMLGYTGGMALNYFDPNTQRSTCVGQFMELFNSPKGLIIAGSNPTYCNTKQRITTYTPDNFLFQISPSGQHIVMTFDTQGRFSPVTLETF